MNVTDDEDLVLNLKGMMFLMHFQNLLELKFAFCIHSKSQVTANSLLSVSFVVSLVSHGQLHPFIRFSCTGARLS